MSANIHNQVEALSEATTEARETIRELHGLMKDARSLRTDMQSFMEDGAVKLVLIAIRHQLPEALGSVATQLEESYTKRYDELFGAMEKLEREYKRTLSTINDHYARRES